MKKLKELLESQHCRLLEVNPNKRSIAFVMPDKKTRVSATFPKPADKATEKQLIKWIANSISGGTKK